MNWTRRRALHAVAAAATTAVAGCNTTSRETDEGPTEQPLESPDEYETAQVRSATDTALFWAADETREDGRSSRGMQFLSTRGDASETAFASNAAGETLRSFVEETDYEAESTLLYGGGVRACFEVDLRGVRRERGSVDIELCHRLRPAETACERDANHRIGIAVRFDDAGTDVDSFGIGGGPCRSRPRPLSPVGGDDE